MNYYERFVGDFQRDTGHLSCTEVGVYDRLLDHYYATENPIPADAADLCRIARAMDRAEQKAVRRVAEEFFPLGEDGLRHNARADREIAKLQKIRCAWRGLSYRKHREFVFRRDGFSCVYCASSVDLELDHVIPQSRGGSDDPENLVTCCRSCNASKGNKTPDEWLNNGKA